MPDYQPIDYRLRCHSKRTDLPADVLRDIGEAYAEINRLNRDCHALKLRLEHIKEGFEGCCNACEPVGEMNKKLRAERDEARRQVCRALYTDEAMRHNHARICEWDCFNTPEGKLDKTLNGVIVDGGKAVPPNYENLEDV